MKKFLVILAILFLLFCGFIVYDKYAKYKIPVIEIQEEVITIDDLYIYGTHLNIEGNYDLTEDAQLVLYNGEFISYNINITDDFNNDGVLNFNLSNLVNDGLYLDDIPISNYYLFIRVKDNEVVQNEEQEEKWKYYALKNNTEYQDTTYYTMSNYNKKVIITNEDSYPTMMMKITKNDNNEVYDIVIDPGHGGADGGASKNGYKETDFTLDISTKVKEKLEKQGFKVKLTHEIGELSDDEKLEEYGVNGRAVIPREVNAKYLFSIHLNSSNYASVSGLEIYTAKSINYDLAKILVDNLTRITGLGYSNNKINKIYDSIYSRNFTEEDISDSLNNYDENDLNPYDITTKSNYYYMIRETGGIVTGAYVDDRNSEIIGNPYVKSNVGTESYLLELGYLSNKNDLNNVINNMNKYVEAISNSINSLYDDIK